MRQISGFCLPRLRMGEIGGWGSCQLWNPEEGEGKKNVESLHLDWRNRGRSGPDRTGNVNRIEKANQGAEVRDAADRILEERG